MSKQTSAEGQQHFNIEINGRQLQARSGQTIAAALIMNGVDIFTLTPSHAPRGIFCGMGVCFDCLVTVDGIPAQRACMTLAQPGMHISAPERSSPSDENH
jgi:predicted molibdopterin-dependent oxidoreductase YjgC